MFGSMAAVGDEIALTRKVAVSLTDSLMGGGLHRGTRGIVLERTGGRLRVRFDSGLGSVHATVNYRDTRIVRRNYGGERFTKRTQVATAIRVGVLFAFAAPFLFFIIGYIWANGTTHGLLPALVDGVIQGTLEALRTGIAHPLQTIIYMIVTGLVWRWAWRH